MTVESTTYPDRDTWLAARGPLITASDAATVLGHNPFDTPLQLALRKRGDLPAKEETEAMRMGHVMQPVIRSLWAQERGFAVTVWDYGEFTIKRNDAYPFAGATLDYGLIETVGDQDVYGALECKNVGARMAAGWEEGAPLMVQIQLQFQLAVTEWDWGSIAAILGGQKFVYADYQRNDTFVAHMMARVQEFHAAMHNGKLPEADAADSDALCMLWPDHVEEKVVELPAEAIYLDEAIRQADDALQPAQEAKTQAQNRLKQMIGDAEVGILPDGTRWSWKTSERKGYEVKPTKLRTLRRLKK